jgi:hypothetical protein
MSVPVSVQRPLHNIDPGGHVTVPVHVPFVHFCPGAQTVLQFPQ